MTLGSWLAEARFTYLTNHDGEGKDTNKVVDELEANLKNGGGVWQTANGDQRLHGKIVAADVAAQKRQRLDPQVL